MEHVINWATQCPICAKLRDPNTEVWRYTVLEDGFGDDPSFAIEKVIFCSETCKALPLPHELEREALDPDDPSQQ